MVQCEFCSQSETDLADKVARLSKDLNTQKRNFKKTLGNLKKDVNSKEKHILLQSIESELSHMELSQDSEEEEEEDLPPLPSQPPPEVTSATPSEDKVSSGDVKGQEVKDKMDLTSHELEMEQLRKEKEEALAEEMRNTKAGELLVGTFYHFQPEVLFQ